MTIAAAIATLNRLTKPGADPRHPAKTIETLVLERMHDAQRGQPGSSMGGGGGHGGSPVENALMQRDIGGEALTQWRQAEQALDAAVRRLERLATEWTPKQPSPKAIRETAQANVRQCENCHDADVRDDKPTTYAGLLAEPLRLCSDCYGFVGRHGRLSNAGEREKIKRGGRVRDTAR